jgi:hypothetical protein
MKLINTFFKLLVCICLLLRHVLTAYFGLDIRECDCLEYINCDENVAKLILKLYETHSRLMH